MFTIGVDRPLHIISEGASSRASFPAGSLEERLELGKVGLTNLSTFDSMY